MDGEDRTGRERKERLRARRDEAGMAQVSGWVPKDRRAYAREVLAAIAQGANSLPPDPEQAAELERAQSEVEAAQIGEATARAKLVNAEERAQAAERGREEAMRELVTVRATARRGQQGWRYLEAADAPPDLGAGEVDVEALPPDLAGKLAVLALI